MGEFDDWQEAGSGSGDTWNFDDDKVVIGTYRRKRDNVGQNASTMYYLQLEGTAEEVGVWGSTVLDNKMSEVPLGSKVRIESLGKPAGKNYKDYSVKFKAPAAAPEWARDAKAAADNSEPKIEDVR